nr:Dihydrofolate reductase [uncultured bacterium]
MQRARVSAIAAIGKNRELGTKNQLSWRISDDLKRLKTLTTGHPLIMGRTTYESIGHPLPNRTNIVVTRDQEFTAEGCIVVHSIEQALEEAHRIDTEEIFIFGGAQMYAATLSVTDRLYLTLIDAEDPGADVFFPEYSEFTEVVEKEKRDQNGLVYEWVTLERAK